MSKKIDLDLMENIVDPEAKKEAVEEVKEEIVKDKYPKDKKREVYIGPTINGVVATGTILLNGRTEEINEAIKKEPTMANLFVKIDCLSKARNDLQKPHTAISIAYQRCLKLK